MFNTILFFTTFFLCVNVGIGSIVPEPDPAASSNLTSMNNDDIAEAYKNCENNMYELKDAKRMNEKLTNDLENAQKLNEKLAMDLEYSQKVNKILVNQLDLEKDKIKKLEKQQRKDLAKLTEWKEWKRGNIRRGKQLNKKSSTISLQIPDPTKLFANNTSFRIEGKSFLERVEMFGFKWILIASNELDQDWLGLYLKAIAPGMMLRDDGTYPYSLEVEVHFHIFCRSEPDQFYRSPKYKFVYNQDNDSREGVLNVDFGEKQIAKLEEILNPSKGFIQDAGDGSIGVSVQFKVLSSTMGNHILDEKEEDL